MAEHTHRPGVSRMRAPVFFLLALLASLLPAACARAADSPSVTIKVHASGNARKYSKDLVRVTGDLAEQASVYTGHRMSGPLNVYITKSADEFSRIAGGSAPDWAVAIYNDETRSIVVRPQGYYAAPDQFRNILKHEVLHAVLGDMFASHPGALPRWLNEGLAVKWSDAWESPESWMKRRAELYAAIREGRALGFEEITHGFPYSSWEAQLAYTQSYDFVSFLMRRGGEPKMRELLRDLAGSRSFDNAFSKTYGFPFTEASAQWEKNAGKPAVVILMMEFFVQFDTYLWAFMAVLTIIGAVRVYVRLKRRRRFSSPPDVYDPDGDWDNLDEEWDPDVYGNRPWRPGKRH